ncbi:hypothetical protein EJ066_23750 [Mesorhizobium sp. M9A.F.Ca.ET.002.03.1.2]|uniref:hypothetical protein n=1 Tax=Mesorhizobium sp. M9A.F.Ca.ET.002.03.1.2 TaxID=2493668 RepID=UPI000F74C9D1|nr:hypothetical protein [Mesorhizobium sp. M9A.F.Ca.ET.002.03.1.2]AZN99898.1 hypothetical protein EJ066_23750 [Mesorhizobium sp. M9A.F.Ca.ET.002.03.1.2]
MTLRIPTANHPYSIIDRKAKPGDKIDLDGEVVHVDEELGRVTVQVLGRVTVDADTVKLVRKYRWPKGTTLVFDEPT